MHEILNPYVEKGLIRIQQHPTRDLYIANYTETCQFTKAWDDVTTMCRGLIFNGDGEIVARPLRKFKNYEEHAGPIPNSEPEIYEKLDGCWPARTALNVWGGGTITIKEIVDDGANPTLVGVDASGCVVPIEVTARFNNGLKSAWVRIHTDANPSPGKGVKSGAVGLEVTTNHHLVVNGRYAPAGDVRPGDKLTNLIAEPDAWVLHVIESSLLGDGCIIVNGTNCKYQESHTSANAGYVNALRQWLGECGNSRSATVSGYGTEMLWAGSKTYSKLNELRRRWYRDGKRVLPADLDWVDDFSVAKWYMDDGSLAHSGKQRDRAVFATNRFSEDEVRRLGQRLEQMYGVSCTVFFSKGWVIRVNAGRNREIDVFWSRIAPYVVPDMRYKLPEEYRGELTAEFPSGKECFVTKDAEVLAVELLSDKRATGYDIETTTHNYFARGVLSHNSLLIATLENDYAPIFATRGSFTSDQALWAEAFMLQNYGADWMEPGWTYCFEIIYPKNRIVVDYGKQEDLVLLAKINTRTGEEVCICCDAPEWKGSRAEQIYTDDPLDFEGLRGHDVDNEEGYVLFWRSAGLRLKVKFPTYVRLHRLLTGVNARHIWECLRDGTSIDDMLEQVPDEFFEWLTTTRRDLYRAFFEYEAEAKTEFYSRPPGMDRKAFAMWVMELRQDGYAGDYYPRKYLAPILFALLDGKSYDDVIWKMIKPQADRPFTMGEAA